MIKSVAILTRPDNKSPKVLAQSFKSMCSQISVKADIFYEGAALLGRLFSLFDNRLFKKNFHFIFRQKLVNYISDQWLIIKLRKYDLIVISECIPNAYWRGYYDVEKLKKKIRKPIAIYEVYYLGNSITHTNLLNQGCHYGIDRYDWNFSISEIAEIRKKPSIYLKWTSIGLHIANCGLKPLVKNEIIAVIDFAQKGFEQYRDEQIEVLASFPQIKLIYLDGEYTNDEIRKIYGKASLFFVQFPEAFGVSIAECLSTGSQVIVKDINWAMSWRLQNDKSEEYLPGCFYVYENSYNLNKFLQEFLNNFDSHKSSLNVYDTFIKHYSHFYNGDLQSLKASFDDIEKQNVFN